MKTKKKNCFFILDTLRGMDVTANFSRPVNPVEFPKVLELYQVFDLVSLREEINYYDTFQQFVEDLERVFESAFCYAKEGSPIYNLATEMLQQAKYMLNLSIDMNLFIASETQPLPELFSDINFIN